MACCIVAALLISELILLWEKARNVPWLNALALVCGVGAVLTLVWHWHHIEELILNPFAFTFVSDLLDQAGSFCRSVLR